ncbi:MAG: chromosome segregation protein SMC [Clostridiales bacterium]|nr:chromosome segregation protein SMC [Clostridiales bacterium]
MFLKSLEMQGFKSFPDKTVLEFGSGMTAVVGPNGSGKSNISDAVRWVLGEQSTKSLRGSKMEDVVFSGTDKRRAQGFAEVTLRLDNSDGALNSDKKEVVVTRRYYRSGESEYKLNGDGVRLKDINELFMDTGLGRDGYSMVSQGKIADMISAKSSERRDMFEEAAGISHYRYRRTDALRRLDQAEENLVRLRDILTELETRVGPLKVQSEKAQKFIALSEEKKELEIGLWLHTIEKTKEELKAHEHKLSLAELQHRTASDELEKIEKEIDESIAGAQKITVEIDEIRRSASVLEEQASALDGQVAVDKNSIEHNNEAIARIEREKAQENDTGKHIEQQVDEAKSAIEQLELRINEKNSSLEQVSDELKEIMSANEQSAGVQAELSGKMSALSMDIADVRVSASTASSSVEEIDARLESIKLAGEARAQAISALNEQKAQAEESLKDIEGKLVELNNSLMGFELRAQNRRMKAEKQKEENDALSHELESKTSKVNMLEELEKNMEGYTGSVKSVMREVKRGTLTGIHAPLSQLIGVNEKYSVAIETALGASIQNIITDTENDAKRAINFLKESRAGRATFLPLAAIKGKALDEKGLDDCFGFINLASELVNYDKKYREIIISQLGRTAVAEDMDSAIAIAKKYSYRFKIVTLDGQVINAGGSMTGGSRVQNAGILSRGNEIDKLKAQLQQLELKLGAAREEYKLAAEALAAEEAKLEGCKAEIASQNEEKIRREGVLALKDGQLSALVASENEASDEAKALNERRRTLASTAEESGKRSEELSKQLEALEQQLAKASGNRETLSAKREELTSRAAEINLDIATARKDIEAQNDAIERLVHRGTSHAMRISELDAEIKEISDKNAALLSNIELLTQQAARLREENSQSKQRIDSLTESRGDFEANSSKMRLLERAKASEREALSGELARLEEQKAAMLKEYEELSAKLFDEYELTRREAEQLGIVIENPRESGRRLAEIRGKIKSLGSVNVGAVEEYKEVSERYEFMRTQISDVEKSRAELTKLIGELTEKMAAQFKQQFDRINESFSITFRELFSGGRAELVLEDEHDVLECGIQIKVQPPGKNVQNIDLLSGGEKGLSAIALLFAILKVTPAPFCIFDEVEAALDDVNVGRYAQYVRRMTGNTQFILITHRRGTMEEADMLYGVTMQEDGVSKLLELKTAEMAKKLGLE